MYFSRGADALTVLLPPFGTLHQQVRVDKLVHEESAPGHFADMVTMLKAIDEKVC